MSRVGTIAAMLLVSGVIIWSMLTWGVFAAGDVPSAAGSEIEAGRFITVPVFVASADEPLAAYQFELREAENRMRVVGVEGGSVSAFAEPPYFDRQAVEEGRADRIIVAAFSTKAAEALPRGRVHVATVHVHLTGDRDPEWQLTLEQAGNAAAEPIEARIAVGTEPEG